MGFIYCKMVVDKIVEGTAVYTEGETVNKIIKEQCENTE